MAIGFSDGTQAENWPQYYTQTASTSGAETDLPTGRAIKQPPSSMPEGLRSRGTPAEEDDPDYKDWLRQQEHERLQPPAKDEDTPMSLDQTHHVPLIASALTKDGQNMYGLAVDHRVPLEMDFEGSKHNITPFLMAHEAAELPVLHDLVKGGMDAKQAYNEAHDRVANPTEAAVRYAYAAKAGLDPDKFNQAYNAHIQKATDIASQPSDREVHPEAHTTHYRLDPKSEKYAENISPLQIDVMQNLPGVHSGPGVGKFSRPANENELVNPSNSFKNLGTEHEYDMYRRSEEEEMSPAEEKYLDALSKQIQNRLTKFRTIKGDKE